MLVSALLPARLLGLLYGTPEGAAVYDELGDPPTEEEKACCAEERACAPVGVEHPVVDVEGRASSVVYTHNGIAKRGRFPSVVLAKRRVLVMLHQTGVERAVATFGNRVHLVTCHRGIGPSGVRYRVHPITERLVAGNRLDRSPWHTIHIEVSGNVEGVDGTGNWWAPDRMGRGRFSDAQLEACRQEIDAICYEVAQAGGVVEGVVPHIISGISSRGVPNRQLDCGSRLWSECGEWAGANRRLAVPAAGFRVNGLPVPDDWRGEWWWLCERRLAA